MVPPPLFIDAFLQREITDREMHALKLVIEIIENHMLESEYPLASLEQRVEQLKGSDANMKNRTPASFLTQRRLQRRKQKRSIKKQKQIGMKKVPRTATSVGPADDTTICQPNSYTRSPATPSGMVALAPAMPSYTGLSSGAYGINLRHHCQASYYPQ